MSYHRFCLLTGCTGTADFVCWLAAVLDAITQSSNQVNINFILKLVKGISRVFQKLLTFFNGAIVSKFWCHHFPFLYIFKQIITSSSTSSSTRPFLKNSRNIFFFSIFFCWVWFRKSVSGPCVGKNLCTWATVTFFLLMIRTDVKFRTDEKSWKRIS